MLLVEGLARGRAGEIAAVEEEKEGEDTIMIEAVKFIHNLTGATRLKVRWELARSTVIGELL